MQRTITEAIINRRTSKKSLDQPVSLELVYQLLEKASYAPFHKREPWQAKIVTTPDEKVIATYERKGLIHDEESQQKFTTKMTRLLKEAPATILFARELIPENPRLDSDAIQATAALIQNFSLLAYEEGLVGFWASSPFVMDQELSEELGFPANYQLIANYRLGYADPTLSTPKAKRSPVKQWASTLL